ncbi:unnamed protein product [Blepharisma stoltei]|uniref:Uncharacterized protein n=1 Tax=Blepharisma stoltei TaxID=1481888 RepID=A0AAU9JJM4_9CILI|nr:unnamed protein product [Blepharisma stoltei]
MSSETSKVPFDFTDISTENFSKVARPIDSKMLSGIALSNFSASSFHGSISSFRALLSLLALQFLFVWFVFTWFRWYQNFSCSCLLHLLSFWAVLLLYSQQFAFFLGFCFSFFSY